MAMKIKIKNTAEKPTDELQNRYLNVLIYGEPGAGKTHFLGTANNHKATENILVLDIEGGMLTLEEQGIDYTEIAKFEDITDTYDFLTKYCHYRDIYFNAKSSAEDKKKAQMQMAVLWGIKTKKEAEAFVPPLYNSVGIDSITELQKINMVKLMEVVVDENPDRDPDVPSVREWGKSGNQIRQVIRAFRGLKMHTIFLALPNVEKDEKSGSITMTPSLPGKLAREVPGFVDIVGYLKSQDKDGKFENQLFVRPFGKHELLKDRTNSLGAGMKMPTLGKIFEKWEAKRSGKATTKSTRKAPVKTPTTSEDKPTTKTATKKPADTKAKTGTATKKPADEKKEEITSK